MNIHQKLIEVRKSAPYLQKANKGAQYSYVSSSQTLSALKAKMDELGLLLVPRVIGKEVRENTNSKGAQVYFTELVMEYTWINAEYPNETITCPWYGQGVDIAGEKGVGKALTYAEKYFMLKFFNIPTDKDDPDAHQKKQDDNDTNGPKQLEAFDKIRDDIDKLTLPDAKNSKGQPMTREAFLYWYENIPDVQKLKKVLDAENLSKINSYFQQCLNTFYPIKKAA